MDAGAPSTNPPVAAFTGTPTSGTFPLTVNFTDPYAYSGLAILANTEMTEGFALEDFNSPDVTFSARRGATPAVVIAEKFPEAQLLLFDEDGAAAQEVLNGNAHATMSSQPTPNRVAGRNPETVYVFEGELFDPRGEAFALRSALREFGNPHSDLYLMGKKAGEKVEIPVPRGTLKYEILAIRFAE